MARESYQASGSEEGMCCWLGRRSGGGGSEESAGRSSA